MIITNVWRIFPTRIMVGVVIFVDIRRSLAIIPPARIRRVAFMTGVTDETAAVSVKADLLAAVTDVSC